MQFVPFPLKNPFNPPINPPSFIPPLYIVFVTVIKFIFAPASPFLLFFLLLI